MYPLYSPFNPCPLLLIVIVLTLPHRTTSNPDHSSTATPFDPREATIQDVHSSIFSRGVSCREIVRSFLDRISSHDKQGPRLNAMLSVNTHALDEADRLDSHISMERQLDISLNGLDAFPSDLSIPQRFPLFCVPILVKDNFDTSSLPTTAGSLSLRSSQPLKDSPTIVKLLRAGAIVLGKTNLQEFAVSAGMSNSSLGGQTLNPYDLTRTPGGSSGGTGSGVAASLGVIGLGTDTVNSIRNPASANSLVGYRSSKRFSDTRGVVPVSRSQDVVGPIGKSVRDVGLVGSLINVGGGGEYILGNVTSLMGLGGLRIGVLGGFVDYDDEGTDPEVRAVNLVFNSTLERLSEAGVDLVRIDDAMFDTTRLLADLDVQVYEYREEMDMYLSDAGRQGSQHRSFKELYDSSEWDPWTLKSFFDTSLIHNTTSPEYLQRLSSIHISRTHLRSIFERHNLSALVYPEQQNLVVKLDDPRGQTRRNGILAAVAGVPVICIPIGFSEPDPTAPIGVPVGMDVMGREGDDGTLFGIAEAMERLVRGRRPPPLGEWK